MGIAATSFLSLYIYICLSLFLSLMQIAGNVLQKSVHYRLFSWAGEEV